MKPAFLLLLAAIASGCAPSLRSEHVITAAPRAPYAGQVKVALDGSPVTGQYMEVAIVSATGSGVSATLPTVLGQLQAEAAGLGCNGVIRVRYDQGANLASATGVAVWMY